MPKYYCDYCDTYLTHDSPSVRKTHCTGRKHRDNVRFYYKKWMEEKAQHLIDATTAAFKERKIAQNPFAAKGGPLKLGGINFPPPIIGARLGLPGMPPMLGLPPPMLGMPPPILGMRAPPVNMMAPPPPLGTLGVRPPILNGPPAQQVQQQISFFKTNF